MAKKRILLGCGGHAGVLRAVLMRSQLSIEGVITPDLKPGRCWFDIPVLGGDEFLTDKDAGRFNLVNGLGSLPYDGGRRKALFESFTAMGFSFETVIDKGVDRIGLLNIEQGVQLLPGAIIQNGTKIAENTIVNTGAIIDHDCCIGAHVHIAPGAVLSGGVTVGDGVHIGTGACVIQGITIGADVVIGAGCIVTRDVVAGKILYPARSVEK
ncbi:NeuD/PglB/VioB family sugar acetyltransferase [methane-oxidizing endosymbiont of Gigantopelta aegis]|uniref:NeuD/PglB/VioB family sugar acetyltransferase n=1 Tax=methane-oxidizing endosymbiont of Gigantopelta aegis TaxID=2794938 RepID=UPI0018DB06B5|nr:NeuD/PglB/VioB family sugar acetyltransferase [methane-oxidizing endosymbiont of Gigantopelta aegis]